MGSSSWNNEESAELGVEPQNSAEISITSHSSGCPERPMLVYMADVFFL